MIRICARRLPHDYALAFGTALALFCAPALLPARFGGAAVWAQAVFATPEAAANAFTDALATNDQGAMKHVLGNDFTAFIPTQSIGQDDIDDYLGAWAKGHRVVPDATPVAGKASAHVEVGDSGWTLPIPIVQSGKGWHFDPREGASEILTRRIGRNERAAMLTSLAYVDAQNDYRKLTQHYALRLVSTPGMHDGLYWPVEPGETESPLGPLAATMPGNAKITPAQGYHGYHFRILTAQGPHASGGARSYLENGDLSGGFALVAWPAQYGKTGVMSFIINQDGQLYQKNLGPNGAQTAAAIKAFDPDSSWQATQP
ncbi:DUF2950 domain-containing protein [Paraburkholderia silvatlantica]|uniref:DUF2950 family protein n=2 Tax=Paraburkholderia silvatlantica TaxID=321895 RepID=A0A2U1A4L6_9BURK|nr:DUF2950 domain-containing protein [Paraburkholderia silvatlantica]MBB2931720.1 hypothetical protein [Paraburkholderia silvatlantica]PVY26368.1 hypothetical protein C7411_12449 [Paraburkholderia silvatlantica]PXW32119.1 hypothetical protein C7413_12349 [Paraburkholderia silvatlantica]PYE18888.1 hypothetical protein C7410_12182 [Paraburkholderia silvatlantica]TDQ82699.1 hypothetical protein C7412_12352 [Paraburkholderia silvatlantica]